MDGEKNLKKRIIPLDSPIPSGGKEPPAADEIIFTGRCKADSPEPSLERFGGNFYYKYEVNDFVTLSI